MGSTVAILAGGPSLTQAAVDEVRRRGWSCIAINDAYRLAPWADVLFAADAEWWMRHPDAMAFAGRKVVCQRWAKIDGVETILPQPPVSTGGNSAVHAACVAQRDGASRIVLLGVDLRDDELTHWHGKHRGPLRNPTPSDFRLARRAWEAAARSVLAGVEVVNCSLRSALTVFPRIALEAVAP